MGDAWSLDYSSSDPGMQSTKREAREPGRHFVAVAAGSQLLNASPFLKILVRVRVWSFRV